MSLGTNTTLRAWESGELTSGFEFLNESTKSFGRSAPTAPLYLLRTTNNFAKVPPARQTTVARPEDPWGVQPYNLGDWFYNRIAEWSQSLPGRRCRSMCSVRPRCCNTLVAEDVNRLVEHRSRVKSENVMMTNYVKETDDEMRRKNTRTFQRIIASLPAEVAEGYGYSEKDKKPSSAEFRRPPGRTRTGTWRPACR